MSLSETLVLQQNGVRIKALHCGVGLCHGLLILHRKSKVHPEQSEGAVKSGM